MESATAPSSTMRRDIVSAYVAVGAKIAAWAIVSAIVFQAGDAQFALLTLVRSTLGLLTYVVLGIGPAIVRMVSEASRVRAISDDQLRFSDPITQTLSYARPRIVPGAEDPGTTVYANGLFLAFLFAVAGMLVVNWYANHYAFFYRTHDYVNQFYADDVVIGIGLGVLVRLISDACGALLQVRGYLWLDNLLLTIGELLWPLMAWSGFDPWSSGRTVINVAGLYAFTGVLILLARFMCATLANGWLTFRPAPIRLTILRALLSYGSIVTLAQLADFLYAPTDFILINRLLTALDATHYAPAVQIDAALLLLVGAIANVLLPKTAVAHARDDLAQIRRYYVRGTFASAAILLCAGMLVWIASPLIFRLWLQNPMFGTRAILPLVLIHTIVGGSSAVGRSILLGMGKVKPFTISVLIAGVGNVILSYVFVRYFNLGLRGIIFGTIIAVVGRCAIWMPWYVLRSLRS